MTTSPATTPRTSSCCARRGVFEGHDGIRTLAATLRPELPDATFEYGTTLVAGEFAFFEWSARSAMGSVDDGADSYVIRDGRIVTQTIHYTIKLAYRSVMSGDHR